MHVGRIYQEVPNRPPPSLPASVRGDEGVEEFISRAFLDVAGDSSLFFSSIWRKGMLPCNPLARCWSPKGATVETGVSAKGGRQACHYRARW